MARDLFAVSVLDTASDEQASFAVEASTALIACTRAARRLLGPEVETRPVFGCAVCGEELWEAEGLDSSGFRFCPECAPEELTDHEPQEPVGVAAGTARISAEPLPRLPGDAPLGEVTVVVADPRRVLEQGEALDDDRTACAALEKALARAFPLEDELGDAAVKDEAGAYFQYQVRVVAVPVDAHDLSSRGLIEETAEDDDEDEEDDD